MLQHFPAVLFYYMHFCEFGHILPEFLTIFFPGISQFSFRIFTISLMNFNISPQIYTNFLMNFHYFLPGFSLVFFNGIFNMVCTFSCYAHTNVQTGTEILLRGGFLLYSKSSSSVFVAMSTFSVESKMVNNNRHHDTMAVAHASTAGVCFPLENRWYKCRTSC